jgi:hypothetical protein
MTTLNILSKWATWWRIPVRHIRGRRQILRRILLKVVSNDLNAGAEEDHKQDPYRDRQMLGLNTRATAGERIKHAICFTREIFPNTNNVFIIWKIETKDMTKVFNWISKLKMAIVEEKTGWKGFRSTGEPNKLSFVCLYVLASAHADMRARASARARPSRAPFAPAHERPGRASHLLATRTRLSSYSWSVLYLSVLLVLNFNNSPASVRSTLSSSIERSVVN